MSAGPYLVIIQGAPGVGKTTLSYKLAKDLSLRCISKDALKEMLYEQWGAPHSNEETKLYGRIAIRSMYVAADEYLRAGQTVIIESPLESQFALDDIAKIIKPERVIQLHAFCDPAVQIERFRRRVIDGSRHVGHGDAESFTQEDAEASQRSNRALSGFMTIPVDTTHFGENEYDGLLTRLKEEMV
ncbi:AAA family ATPase [Candidatus Saccharibacteria bacterium TM7i]|nr:AAA family ATPase [Candidatus Saccharibacteria bacterium TM7i]